ncbi:hypothetical protein OUZ56_011139 [Daphnia magna]|uniref:Uncharacterized protein n=1 Tax=Daphnia magna TaxID=35525 RepID=A0ABQ9YZJ7_9CRUS|nr:hypothetical protein OUZ56_011139 [Daphnia magna]
MYTHQQAGEKDFATFDQSAPNIKRKGGIGKLSYTLPDNGSMDLGVDPNVVSPTIDPADFCRAKNKKAFFIAHSTVLQYTSE